MAVNLVYQTDPTLAIGAAQQVGAAQYANQQAELDRQDARFQQELTLRQQMAMLQDAQQRRSLGAQMGNAAAGREAAYANSQMENERAMALAQIQQQGYAGMRQSDEAMKTADIASRERMMLSSQQSKLLQDSQNRRFQVGLASAENLEKTKNTMSPAMYEQARSQWDSQFGEVLGEYPFVAGKQQAPDVQRQSAASALERYFPGGVEDDVTQAYLEMSGPEKLAFRMEAEKTLAANEKYKVEAEVKQQTAEREDKWDTYQKEKDMAAKERSNLLDRQNQEQALETAKRTSDLKIVEGKITTFQKALTAEKSYDPKEQNKDRIAALEADLNAAYEEHRKIGSTPSSVDLLGGGGAAAGQGSSKQNPVSITNDDEFDALPDGAYYKGPDNVVRRK